MLVDTTNFQFTGWMIRRNSDGLFSRGGNTPKFTKKGKVWLAKSHLTNHLNLVLIYPNKFYRTGRCEFYNPYENCEIFKLTEKGLEPDNDNLLNAYVEKGLDEFRKSIERCKAQ